MNTHLWRKKNSNQKSLEIHKNSFRDKWRAIDPFGEFGPISSTIGWVCVHSKISVDTIDTNRM